MRNLLLIEILKLKTSFLFLEMVLPVFNRLSINNGNLLVCNERTLYDKPENT